MAYLSDLGMLKAGELIFEIESEAEWNLMLRRVKAEDCHPEVRRQGIAALLRAFSDGMALRTMVLGDG